MSKLRVAIATDADLDAIYHLRHDVYANELGQHAPNDEERLCDALDAYNEYIIVADGPKIVGFVSLTPPGGSAGYSVDKYFARAELPFAFDTGLFEVRLLTVCSGRRGRSIAALLLYGALRRVEARGGTRIVAIGRCELLGLYRKVGLQTLGPRTQAGQVTYELMSATVTDLRARAMHFAALLCRLRKTAAWELDMPFDPREEQPRVCFHGGAFWEAVGDTFDTLERGREIVNADVLDAWFPPSPRAVEAIREHLPWLMKTSPPQQAGGLIRTIAEARGVPPDSIVVGAGSSSLIYLALRHWLNTNSRVLLPDPTYGEYAHLFERVIGCRTDRLPLLRADDFRLWPNDLLRRLWQERYDLAILVNPNNPTGQLIPRAALEPVLAQAPPHTRIWIDEAYMDYANNGRESAEVFAAGSPSTIVCKSLSKGYALSGLRAAYLCGPPGLMAEIRDISPPWVVSLPAQVAAVAALRDPAYYAARYRETVVLRDALTSDLKKSVPLLEIVPSAANWILCHLPPSGPAAATVCARCREQDVFLRDAGTMGGGLDCHTLRIAVKKEADNQRIVQTLADAIHP